MGLFRHLQLLGTSYMICVDSPCIEGQTKHAPPLYLCTYSLQKQRAPTTTLPSVSTVGTSATLAAVRVAMLQRSITRRGAVNRANNSCKEEVFRVRTLHRFN